MSVFVHVCGDLWTEGVLLNDVYFQIVLVPNRSLSLTNTCVFPTDDAVKHLLFYLAEYYSSNSMSHNTTLQTALLH